MSVYKELVSKHDPSKSYKGYTLFSQEVAKDVHLVDMDGRFVHHWHTPYQLGMFSELLPNGNLFATQRYTDGPVTDMPGYGGKIIEMDWDGNVVWEYEDVYMDSHEVKRMENGNTMFNHWLPLTNDIATKVKGGIPGTEREGVMWEHVLQEITPDGKVVWEWVPHEHIDLDKYILCPLCPRDFFNYVNSLHILPDGNILTHFRVSNTVAIIDKVTGNIVWQWGPGEIGHAHNATYLDNGRIMLFDNGYHRSGDSVGISFSRVIEVDIETKKIMWEYKAPDPSSFYSSVCSGAQRLPNGNTLICEATKGRIFEVTSEKEIVWEFTNPFHAAYLDLHRRELFGTNNWVYRALRYGPDYEGLRGKALDPDSFEWILHEKGKAPAVTEITLEEQAVSRRITRLGY